MDADLMRRRSSALSRTSEFEDEVLVGREDDDTSVVRIASASAQFEPKRKETATSLSGYVGPGAQLSTWPKV
jgi:hypothetical protein